MWPERLLQDARDLQSAGADIVLLECIPKALGKAVTEALEVPVIGIGAGPDVSGQIQVLYDILDITPGPQAEVRAQFHGGQRHAARGVEGLCGRREVARLSRPRALLL